MPSRPTINGQSVDQWSEEWVRKRLLIIDEDEYLSTAQKKALPAMVEDLISKVGYLNVASIINTSGWSTLLPAISWHLEALNLVSQAKGGTKFLERVIRDALEDAPVILELAWRLISAGAEIELEPSIKVHGITKHPDFALLNPSGLPFCFVEASVHTDSADQIESDSFAKQIQLILFQHRHMKAISGSFFRILNSAEIERFTAELEAAITALESLNEAFVFKPGAYELIITEDSSTEETHEDVCSKYGIKPRTLIFPPFDPNEEGRMLQKLNKEMKHFPPKEPAVIVIEAHPMMVLEEKRSRFTRLRDTLHPWLLKHPNCVALIVTARCIGLQPSRHFEMQEDVLIEQSLGYTALDHTMIFNPSFIEPSRAKITNILQKAFLCDYYPAPQVK